MAARLASRCPRACGFWPPPPRLHRRRRAGAGDAAAAFLPCVRGLPHDLVDPELLQRAVEPALPGGRWRSACGSSGGADGAFVDEREQLPYLVFFLGALLTSFGSAYYHLAPDNPRLVWDRLPMTLGFAGLVAAAVAERVDQRLGLRSLWPLLAVGAGTVIYWYATERMGAGNIIPYAAYQGWSILAIVLLIAVFPAQRYSHGALLLWAAGWYGLAKVFETFDLAIYRLLGGTLSGHTIKHLLAAGAVFAIVRQLRLRRARSQSLDLRPA